MKKFLKNLLLRNCSSDFEIISQECSLGDPFQKLFAKLYLSMNMALVNGGFLHYRDMRKFLKHLLLRNCYLDLEIISQECWVTLFKNWSRNFDPSINMDLVNGGFSHCRDMGKFLKNFLLRNCWSDFEIISQECSLGDPLQKMFAKFLSVYKYGSSEWRLFAQYGHDEILKKLFSPKPLVRFGNNFTGMFFG